MKKGKMVLWFFTALLIIAAVVDGVRYLKPGEDKKLVVKPFGTFATLTFDHLVLVYNANGGIYPGVADFAHKILSPSTYACRLCYLSFGTFSMKQEWKEFLDSLPYTKVELHKDELKRRYQPSDLQLPVILAGKGERVQMLASAEEINRCRSLAELMLLVRQKLGSRDL